MNLEQFGEAYEFVDEYYSQQHGWSPEKQLFRTRVKHAYEVLENRAQTQRTISYRELWTEIDSGRRYIGPVLDAIGFMEENAGNPPLTVLVVKSPSSPASTERGDGYPSEGFEEQLEMLGIRDRYQARSEAALVDSAKAEVFEHHNR